MNCQLNRQLNRRRVYFSEFIENVKSNNEMSKLIPIDIFKKAFNVADKQDLEWSLKRQANEI